jgi:hypothetical protein
MSTKRTYWIALLMLLVLTTTGVNAGVRDGLVAYYSFDEGTDATAADLSGNGHDATLPESGGAIGAGEPLGGAIGARPKLKT